MKRAWWNYIPHFLVGVGALWLLWRLRLVLAPFVIAYLLAAVLDPLVDTLEKRGCPRGGAVFGIFLVLLAVAVVGLLKVVPVAVTETAQFAHSVPGYVRRVPALIDQIEKRLGGPVDQAPPWGAEAEGARPSAPLSPEQMRARLASLPGWRLTPGGITKTYTFPDFDKAIGFVDSVADMAGAGEQHRPEIRIRGNTVTLATLFPDDTRVTGRDLALAQRIEQLQAEGPGSSRIPKYLRDAVTEHLGPISKNVAGQVSEWAQGAVQSAGFLIWLLIIPLSTFYLLNDIDRIRARFLQIMPDKHRDTAQGIGHDVASVFLSYLRGLSAIAFLYGVAMLVVLLACRVPYAVALGIMAGVLYPVPILGPVITTITMFVVAGMTRGWALGVGVGLAPVVANVFFDNVLSPRIIGKSLGLHPVLSMLALLVGAQLFGLVGMIIAYPMAGAIQVVALRLLPRLRALPAPEPVPLAAETEAPKPAPKRRPRRPAR